MANGCTHVGWVDGKEFSFNGVAFKVDEWGNVYRKEGDDYQPKFKYVELDYSGSVVSVVLTANRKRKRISLARLVLQAHDRKRKGLDYVALHIDGDKDNHRIENLKWVTRSEFYRISGKESDEEGIDL